MTAPHSSLQLVDVVTYRNPQYNHPPQCYIHDLHVLSLCVEGSGFYRSGPMQLPIRSPWFALFPAGDEDYFGLAGPVYTHFVNFAWPGTTFTAEGATLIRINQDGLSQLVPRCIQPDGTLIATSVRLFEQMQHGVQRQDLFGRWQAQAAFLELFMHYMTLPPVGVNPSTHRTLIEFRQQLELRACDTIAINAIAETVQLSPDHLRGLFKQHFGISPQAYRTSIRMNHALSLLRATTLNVSEVAVRVGYDDPLYFSRAFRRHFGIPPSRVIRVYQT